MPANHIVVVDMKPDADVDRATWDKVLRPKLRATLAEHKLDSRVRCFVTSWDVPLRIGPRPQELTVVAVRKELLDRARAERLDRLAESLRPRCLGGRPEA